MDMASEMDARNVGTYDEYQRTFAENERLRAEVDRLRGENEVWQQGLKLSGETCDRVVAERDAVTARAEAAEAIVAVLRGALETLNHAAKVAISTEYGGCFDEETPLVIRLLDGTCDETDATLALTPASAGNRIKAEAYREAARLVDSCSAETLHREADRMEKEGANGR